VAETTDAGGVGEGSGEDGCAGNWKTPAGVPAGTGDGVAVRVEPGMGTDCSAGAEVTVGATMGERPGETAKPVGDGVGVTAGPAVGSAGWTAVVEMGTGVAVAETLGVGVIVGGSARGRAVGTVVGSGVGVAVGGSPRVTETGP
jgi:hypothetical protein